MRPLLTVFLLCCHPNSGTKPPSTDPPDTTTPPHSATPTATTADTASVTGGLVEEVDPGPPAFPSTLGTLTITARTGSGSFDGADNHAVQLCLSASRCFTLDTKDVDDFRRGELDVWHVEGVALPRAEVDRVELRSSNGSDMWRPSCLDLRFDGEPVYCNDALDIKLGDGGGDELTSWSDPAGLHNACQQCSDGPLTHGPMLGGPSQDSAAVWVRTDATRAVSLWMGTAADGSDARSVAWAYPAPEDDFSATLRAAGASPDTHYFYRVLVDGSVQATGSLKTAPALGTPGKVHIAYGSCTKQDAQPIFNAILAQSPDAFFFVGDNHYGNTADLDALWWNYRWARSRAGRSTLIAQVPVLATWDDHDFVGNNTDGFAPGREQALRAFVDYWANPSAGTPSVPGTFFAYHRGDVDVFFLDDRYWRGWDDSLLGAGQTAWLKSELAQASGTFKLLVSGSRFTSHGSSDSWAAFPAASADLFDFIRDQRIDGVVLLSGDIHRADFRSVERASQGGYDLPELTSSPLAYSPRGLCVSDPEQEFCYRDTNSWVSLEIDTTLPDPTLTAELYNESGGLVHSWTLARSSLTVP